MDLSTGCVERPWGFYQLLTSEPTTYSVKRLVILPGRRLSMQYHLHRTEHWYIAHGSGTATVGEASWPVSPGSTADVACGTVHRLEAYEGEEPLVVIEVQRGDLLSEDDIVRLADDFGRA